ncbi:DUF397 domain-containing protein [Streptomyces tendae]|uniref:DUF397 domain-containing protein n=1 Tax=Streptomyces tendae TaxID=1932 RepID=UPI0024918C4D|nr:DUF397 domain-containing protein [Streptomyces tendae]
MSIDKEVSGADSRLRWIKSSYSSEEGGECVEVAIDSTAVHVHDSKQTLECGAVLTVGPVAWLALLDAM